MLVERGGERLVGVLGQVVVHERGLVGGDADHRLLELHLDQPALGAELDDVALDLDRHARHELGALQHGEHVVQRRAALELERGQAGRDLVEAGAVLVERRQRLVGLGEHDGDVLEDVLGAVDVERDDLAALGDRDHERVGLLGDALGGAVAGAGLEREDRRVRHQLDVGHARSCVAFALRTIAPSIFATW